MVTLRGYFIYFELRVFLQSNGTILNIEYLKEGFSSKTTHGRNCDNPFYNATPLQNYISQTFAEFDNDFQNRLPSCDISNFEISGIPIFHEDSFGILDSNVFKRCS